MPIQPAGRVRKSEIVLNIPIRINRRELKVLLTSQLVFNAKDEDIERFTKTEVAQIIGAYLEDRLPVSEIVLSSVARLVKRLYPQRKQNAR